MKRYKVEIAIDVDAKTPREAAVLAWDTLLKSSCDPVCSVFDGSGDKILVDLEEGA